MTALLLAGTKTVRVWFCLLVAIGCGCSCSETSRARNEAPPIVGQLIQDADGRVLLCVLENQNEVFRGVLSDAPVVEAQVEKHALDFNGDGIRDLVVYVWEGQNSGDRVLVFGKRYGQWSQWLDVRRPHFKSEFLREGGRDLISILDPDTNRTRVFSYQGEGFSHP